jgi:hypothetical protein
MLCTITIDAPGNDLPSLGNKVPQRPYFLVVYQQILVSTETTYFLPWEYSFFRWHNLVLQKNISAMYNKRDKPANRGKHISQRPLPREGQTHPLPGHPRQGF